MTDLSIKLLTKLTEAKYEGDLLRIQRITRHYENQVTLSRMALDHAIDRAFGDVLGQNRAKDKEQRGA